MLPHIIQSTTRAAIAQNPAHTLRNVLQLQTPSAGTGSSWGNGPGPGGSKYNPGSRFHSTYNTAGRAVTHANAITSQQDGPTTTNDDTEEVVARPSRTRMPVSSKRPRTRSSSVSLSVAERDERGEHLGVLQTVQIHTRAHRVFGPVETLAAAKQRLLSESTPVFDDADGSTRPLLVRRNSTSSPLSPLLDPSPPPRVSSPPPLPLDGVTTEPIQTQTVTPPPTPPQDQLDEWVHRFQTLPEHNQWARARTAVHQMVEALQKPTLKQFNAAMHALVRSRPDGESVTEIVQLYNLMLERDVLPDVVTYKHLINAFASRDWEVHNTINILNLRIKGAQLLGRQETAVPELDVHRIAELKKEANFSMAMTLFESVLASGHSLPSPVFTRLLRSCSAHANVDAAIHVFAQFEKAHHHIPPAAYRFMIQTFSNANRIGDAEVVFASFHKACEQNRISYNIPEVRANQIMVWNAMIEGYFKADQPEKAIELVDQMVRSQAGDHFSLTDVPVTTSSTFTTVIAGFINNGDIQSALSWFDRLLLQEQGPSNPYEGLGGKAMRPDPLAWNLIIDGLAQHGKVDELNRLFLHLTKIADEDGIRIAHVQRQIVFTANIARLASLSNEQALERLQFICDHVYPSSNFPAYRRIMEIVSQEYAVRGEYATAFGLLNNRILSDLEAINKNTQSTGSTAGAVEGVQRLQYELLGFTKSAFSAVSQRGGTADFPFSVTLEISRLFTLLSLRPSATLSPYFLHSYGQAKKNSLLPFQDLRINDWNLLLDFATQYEFAHLNGTTQTLPVIPNFAFGGVVSLLQDIASQAVTFDALNVEVGKRVLDLLRAVYGAEQMEQVLSPLGESYVDAWKNFTQVQYSALESALSQDASPSVQPADIQSSSEYPSLIVNHYLSRSIEDMLRGPNDVTERLVKAYELFDKNLGKGAAPQPSTIGKLIQSLGRLNELDKVRELYSVAQVVLKNYSGDAQFNAWVLIEDSMIVALAHSGHVDAAHVHRMRILEHGGSPSGDAYGVLIQYVRDTTDDTSGALALFSEAMERGVKPNLYLYNNIISKLSKARKADHALELFQQMKAAGVQPSSITYGTVIGACARVGDVVSAENLFQEMIHSRGFKPRVPPYNTMMQLHTTTKPSRESALYYYDQLRRTGIKPSAHTYKLLLDAYGTIEPIDLGAMEKIFETIQRDPSVQLTGAHFASLINAYGCVNKDLDKAIEIFESIPTFPGAPAADAVVYEALVNAIVAHKRTELLPKYIGRMKEQGVHMTAYIANFLIKGYANVGDLGEARAIFESLLDPPGGVAAPGNHSVHSGSLGTQSNGSTTAGSFLDGYGFVQEPVYREPSTWEVMVRAELGAGNRDAALDLLERLKARQYPEAVYNRISGVLTDHSEPLL